MLVVLTSPSTVAPAPGNLPRPDVVSALINLANQGYAVGIVSNHAAPLWFQQAFGNSNVQFRHWPARQKGEVIQANAEFNKLQSHDVVVLAGSNDDIAMAKNGRAMLVAAGWSNDRHVQDLGVPVADGAEFQAVLGLINNWPGVWWFQGDTSIYSVRALADLSSMNGQTVTQQVVAGKIKATVKGGGPRLTALLTIASRSLLQDGVASVKKLLWGVYPSSASSNNDGEVLSAFSHRLRTISSRVHMARRGEPLFIRHSESPKRHAMNGIDRTDPSSQVETICLNPAYRHNIVGRQIIVLDDCTTYGVSFGVAAALLRKAGAAAVLGLGLGKFGNSLRYYQIDIQSDPFAPIPKGAYKWKQIGPEKESYNQAAKSALQQLIV